jgi:hypothetical protein
MIRAMSASLTRLCLKIPSQTLLVVPIPLLAHSLLSSTLDEAARIVVEKVERLTLSALPTDARPTLLPIGLSKLPLPAKYFGNPVFEFVDPEQIPMSQNHFCTLL